MPQDGSTTPAAPDPGRITTAQQFGAELTLAKERAGLTVRRLSREADVPGSTVQDYLTGLHLPHLDNVDPLKRILAACGERGADRVEQWISALARVRRAPGRRAAPGAPPYRGLTGFEQADAAWFHGREELTARIVGRLERLATEGGRALIVVGSSGAGKSSLLRAGVMPALQEFGYLPRLLTPGAQPSRALASAIRGDGDGERGRLVLVVDQFEEIFTHEVAEPERQEFINTLCKDRPAGASADPVAVLGMRADFYVPALEHPALAEVLQNNQILVTPMTVAELRRVIVEPARQANLVVEDGLVELVLSELTPRVGGSGGTTRDVGTLPLLSHAMQATWARHRGNRLTVGDYLAVGGIAGSISKSAGDVYSRLSATQQETARRLFMRLVHISEDAGDTRRRVVLTDLLDGHSETEIDDRQEVLDRFVAARLLTVGEETVEISHEALLTAWPQLFEWIDGDREWLHRHHALGADAEQWRAAGRDPELLYRGGKLAILRAWIEAGGRRGELNAVESEFFDAGVRREQEQEARERRRLRWRRGFVVLLAVLILIAAGTGLYARQAIGNRQTDQVRALSRQVAAEASGLRNSDVPLSMQLALAAYEISPTLEAYSSLVDSTGVTPATRVQAAPQVLADAIAANGDLVAIGSADGAVRLMAAQQKNRVAPVGEALTGAAGPIDTLAFTRDGHLLVAAGADGLVHLWDTGGPGRPRSLPALVGPGSLITSVVVSTDGRTIAANSVGGAVWLWSGSEASGYTLAATVTGPTKQVNSLALTPDGSTLAAGGDDSTVWLWRVADPVHPTALGVLSTTNGRVLGVAISPDGQTLAAGSSEGHDVYLWDIRDPSQAVSDGRPLTGPATWVNTVAFSPDGRTLAAGGSDAQLWLFDLGTRQSVGQLPHPRPVTGVAYLSDGTPVTVTVDDGMVRVWRLPGPIIAGMKDAVFAATFDASGKRLGVSPGANDNTLTVWDTSDSHHPVELGAPIPGSAQQRFSGSGTLTPDGDVFFAGDVDGTVQVWDVADPAHFAPVGPPVKAAAKLIESVDADRRGDLLAVAADDGTVHLYGLADERNPTSDAVVRTPQGANIYQVAFSPDEKLMVAASEDHHAYLYDLGDPRKPVLLAALDGFSSAAYSAAFNRTGDILAVGSADGTVRIWNVTDKQHPRLLGLPLGGPIGYVYSLAFSPTADILAAGGNEDGGVWLWDLSAPARPTHAATLAGPSNGVFWVSFGPDGRTLVAGGVNRTVQTWDIDPRSAADWICSAAGQPVSQHEWDQYIPGRTYGPICDPALISRSIS